MIFADSHTHLYLDDFAGDRDEMIRRALDEGVRYLFLPNIEAGSVGGMLALAEKYPGICFPMMGLHPTSVRENYREELQAIESALEREPDRFCAIGEIGIDLYWDRSRVEEQKEAFSRQLDLAVQHRLPAVIHTRNSFEVAAQIVEVKGSQGLKGIFHCFSGNMDQARKAVSLGFALGIGGVVTFRDSGLQKIVREIPLEHLVLETDAPFLAPVPYRGKRNESSYIPFIARKVAELKGIPVEIVAEITTHTALEIFNLKNTTL